MPRTTITHEPWCVVHSGRDEGDAETCATECISFGTTFPTETEDFPRGSLYIDVAEDDTEPHAFLEYATPESRGGFGKLDLVALRAVRAALIDAPDGLLSTITETLAALEAKVSA